MAYRHTSVKLIIKGPYGQYALFTFLENLNYRPALIFSNFTTVHEVSVDMFIDWWCSQTSPHSTPAPFGTASWRTENSIENKGL